jgi:hypothetical protein
VKEFDYGRTSHLCCRTDLVAIGEVSLWGRVVGHDAGYRAQFAYPRRILLIVDDSAGHEFSTRWPLMYEDLSDYGIFIDSLVAEFVLRPPRWDP